jgi:exodeoxyribonuclease V alpha subunit
MQRLVSDQPRWLEALAQSLGEALPRLYGDQPEPLLRELITALTQALAEGQLEIPLPSAAHGLALLASPLAAEPDGPLVLEGEQVLWRRWQQQRQAVREALLLRAGRPLPQAPPDAAALKALLAVHGEGLDSQQQAAVKAVLCCSVVLLEGGPGTGKTSTVAQMLAAAADQQPGCRIQLAAPTGKAAARLRSALADGPWPCSTLHRLLESRGERFGRNRSRPLELDLLVIDEVSMLDVPLAAALLEALPDTAQLVLVGDGAQLPPVGPGSLLRDLQRADCRRVLGAGAVELRRTYRNNGAIAQVAAALRQGVTELAPLLDALPADANLQWRLQPPPRLPEPLLERLRQHQQELQQLAQAGEPEPLLAALERCLVLCPLRRGPWGVAAIHRVLLADRAQWGPDAWPLGTPVLCPHNLDELGLANGDLGVVVAHQGQPRLLFGRAADPLLLHPAQLPAVEPALAMTVHKAQGSEADEVWVLLDPAARQPRPLLYTALTRARRRAWLISATPPTLEPVVDRGLEPER